MLQSHDNLVTCHIWNTKRKHGYDVISRSPCSKCRIHSQKAMKPWYFQSLRTVKISSLIHSYQNSLLSPKSSFLAITGYDVWLHRPLQSRAHHMQRRRCHSNTGISHLKARIPQGSRCVNRVDITHMRIRSTTRLLIMSTCIQMPCGVPCSTLHACMHAGAQISCVPNMLLQSCILPCPPYKHAVPFSQLSLLSLHVCDCTSATTQVPIQPTVCAFVQIVHSASYVIYNYSVS